MALGGTQMAKLILGDVLFNWEGRVLRVTINRPDKHNPLSRPRFGISSRRS